MKTFCDLRATDLNFSLVLRPICHNGAPRVTVRINGLCVLDDSLEQTLEYGCGLPLLDPIDLEIGLREKVYSSQLETAVVIDHLSIDRFDLVPRYSHQATYVNDHDWPGATNYLGFNGHWRLNIPEPFYVWKHRITAQGWLLKPH